MNTAMRAAIMTGLVVVLGCGIAVAGRDEPAYSGWVYNENLLSPRESVAQRLVLESDIAAAHDECLSAAGIDPDVVRGAGPVMQDVPGSDAQLSSRSYSDMVDTSLPEVEFATRWGYAISTDQPTMFDEKANEEARIAAEERDEEETIPIDTQQMYALSQSARCLDKSTKEPSRADSLFNDTVDVAFKAQELYANDERTIRFYSAWSQCMGAQGFDYSSPFGAFLEFHRAAYETAMTGAVSPLFDDDAERKVATASVTCGGGVRDFREEQLRDVWRDAVNESGLR